MGFRDVDSDSFAARLLVVGRRVGVSGFGVARETGSLDVYQ